MALSSTSFRPGQSGNPGGRPRIDENIRKAREAVRARVSRYLGILDRIAHGKIQGDPARLNVRVRASILLLQVAGVQLQPDPSFLAREGPMPPASFTPEQFRDLLGKQREAS